MSDDTRYRVQYRVYSSDDWQNSTAVFENREHAEACAIREQKKPANEGVKFRVEPEPGTVVSDDDINAYCEARDAVDLRVREVVLNAGHHRGVGTCVEEQVRLLRDILDRGYAGPFPILPRCDYDSEDYDDFDEPPPRRRR